MSSDKDSVVSWILSVSVAVVVLAIIVAFFEILKNTPEELGSEEYRIKVKELEIKKQVLDIVEQKGDISLEPTSLSSIWEPQSLPALRDDRDKL